MGKRRSRSRSRSEEDELRRRIKRLERKLKRKKEKRGTSTASGKATPPATPTPSRPLTPPTPPPPPTPPQPQLPQAPQQITPEDHELTEMDLPEEILAALGKEGEVIEVIGDDIQSHLATRWTNILQEGLRKEARESLIKKYPTPGNFSRAVPPVINPEMAASLSETTLKRDKRITFRQVLVGKLLTALGKALTSIMKGDISTKNLVEQLNDSAKLAAEVYHQDTASRRFFVAAGSPAVVKETMKDCKADKLLFGKNYAEKLKAAQAIQRSAAVQSKLRSKENWKSPLPPQLYRSGPTPVKKPAQRTQQAHRPQQAQRTQQVQRAKKRPAQHQQFYHHKQRRY